MTAAGPALPYVGSGPYCYASSLAMVLGDAAPDVSAVEVLTGSPFGLDVIGGILPFFDPPGWDPGIGLDAAVDLLGWACDVSSGGTADEALDRLSAAVAEGPALVGPVEMGLLLHQPGSGQPIGADHYVVALAVAGDVVLFHDPHGHPYATAPTDQFLDAWRADSITYAPEPFVLRTGFRTERPVGAEDALRASLPRALAWLAGDSAAGAEAAAEMVAAGLEPWQRDHLVHFAVRVGARRVADAERWLAALGCDAAARVAGEQARLIGGMQHALVTGDDRAVVSAFRALAPTYPALRDALA